MVFAVAQDELIEGMLEWVQYPILEHARTLVKLPLEMAIIACGGLGCNLDQKFRRSLDFRGSDDGLAGVQDNDEVGLYDIEVGQLNVDGE